MEFFGVQVLIVFICKFDEICLFCTPVGLMGEWKLKQNASDSFPLKQNVTFFLHTCTLVI